MARSTASFARVARWVSVVAVIVSGFALPPFASAQQTATLTPQDTYLNVDATTQGSEATLTVYTWPDYKPANAIVLKFDLSSIPAGSTITSAALSLSLVQRAYNGGYCFYARAGEKVHT